MCDVVEAVCSGRSAANAMMPNQVVQVDGHYVVARGNRRLFGFLAVVVSSSSRSRGYISHGRSEHSVARMEARRGEGTGTEIAAHSWLVLAWPLRAFVAAVAARRASRHLQRESLIVLTRALTRSGTAAWRP